ncbi:uncharacterized protein PAC_16109 [Phialocephala subalpina]|uniref:Uncharacterized protein n=1 Tax=Phialocephala subalpina TaxID=576137 RepID=A0A1L7XMG5_9HELO|nr:uncharacterized protein PAC_16109 [Phialocephala subalpina]
MSDICSLFYAVEIVESYSLRGGVCDYAWYVMSFYLGYHCGDVEWVGRGVGSSTSCCAWCSWFYCYGFTCCFAVHWGRYYLKAHNGIEANSLHSVWSYSPMGGGAYFMIRHGFKNMNRIAVASTLTAMVGIVYSPLLQKSSGVASASIGSSVLKNLLIVPKIPDNHTGYNYGKFYGSIGVYDEFSAVIQRWSLNNSNRQARICMRCLDSAGNPMLLVAITFIDSVEPSNCFANLITKTCNISAGTVSFPIKMTNTTILTNEKSLPITNFRPTPYEGDKPDAKEGSDSGLLGGLAWLGYNLFWTTDMIAYDNSSTFTDLINGTMSVTYYDYDF